MPTESDAVCWRHPTACIGRSCTGPCRISCGNPAHGTAAIDRAARERRAPAGVGQAMAGNGRGGGRRAGRSAPHEPGVQGYAGRRTDLTLALQYSHAPLYSGLEAAGPRSVIRHGDRQLRGRFRGLRAGTGGSHAGGSRADHGTPAAAGQRAADPLLERAGGTVVVPQVLHGAQLRPMHGSGYIGTCPSRASVRSVCRIDSCADGSAIRAAARAGGGGTPEPRLLGWANCFWGRRDRPTPSSARTRARGSAGACAGSARCVRGNTCATRTSTYGRP